MRTPEERAAERAKHWQECSGNHEGPCNGWCPECPSDSWPCPVVAAMDETDEALAEVERLKLYEPCNPCKARDHDNCTGECSSNCCALVYAEAEVERLRGIIEEARGCFGSVDDGRRTDDVRLVVSKRELLAILSQVEEGS